MHNVVHCSAPQTSGFGKFAPLVLALLTALSCLCVAPVNAQQITADVVGTVTDQSGATIAGAKVAIKNEGTGETRKTETNPSGEYVFPLLSIGRYVVRAEATGFSVFEVPGLTLTSGARVRVDAHLQVGQQSESIEVIAQPPALQTDSSSLNTTVSEQAIQDLPTNGRNLTTLALLTPGANAGPPMGNGINSGTRPNDRRATNSISVNGQSDMLNNHLIDGLDNNIRTSGTVSIRPSIDAVAEVRVQTNVYSAESGRTAGGVINVLTKSGTNQLHGSLYEFLRNDRVDARDFFALRNPEYRQSQFGGSAGGPIFKNKTFFFTDVEALRQIQGVTATTTVPTAYEQAHPGDFSDIKGPVVPSYMVSPIGLAYFKLYPLPNKPGAFNNYSASPNRTQFATTYDVRIDHHITDRDSMFGRYSHNNTDTVVPGLFPAVNGVEPGGDIFGFQGPSHQTPESAQLNYLHIFNSKLLLELKSGYTRFVNNTLPLNYGKQASEQLGMPGVNINDITSGLSSMMVIGYGGLGDGLWMVGKGTTNVFQYSGSLAYNVGNHSMKTGATLIRRQANTAAADFPVGWFIFAPYDYPPISTTNAAANLIMGWPVQSQRGLPINGTRGNRNWEPGVYVQDDWRIRPWLTLNLGVRYDVFPPTTEVHNWLSNFDPVTAKLIVASSSNRTAGTKSDFGNLAPRFGFAATLPHSLVVRGGYGISYFPGNFLGTDAPVNAPFYYTFGPVNFRPLSAGFPALAAPDPSQPSGTINALALDFKASYLQQYNLTIQRQFGANVLSAGYVGQLGRRLPYGSDLDINRPNPSTLPNPMSIAPYAGVLPNVTSIRIMTNGGTSSYQGLQTAFQRQLTNGLGINTNWTWGHAIDDVEIGSSPLSPYGLLPRAIKAYERSSGDLDIRHRITFSANYNLPFGKSLHGLGAAIGKGWQVNTLTTWQSGAPFTVTNSNPQSNLGPSVTSDRPNRIASGDVSNPGIDRWFDTSAFVPQQFGTIGNEGRNILRGPHSERIDVSLFKEFPVKEQIRLQLRSECYNLSNTPSFSLPNSGLGTAGFGSISSTVPGVGPRIFQFALKALF